MKFDYLLFYPTLKNWILSTRHRRRLYYSRKSAKLFLMEIRKAKGKSVIDRQTKQRIREYAKKRFGHSGYASWLMVYTELRGEFKEGWIPDDFFAYEFIPFLNDEHLTHLSDLKSFDSQLFEPHAIVPIGRKVNNIFFDAQGRRVSEKEWIEQIQKTGGEIVIKSDNVQSGQGMQFLQAETMSASHFPGVFDYIVQPAVRQHKELYNIHRHSISTIRVTTYINPDGEITVKHRSLRMGAKEQRTVNQSGMFVFLNDEGEVISNIFSRIGIDLGPVHPDSGFRLPGYKVPGLKKAVEICMESHLRFPYLRFIAWDLYIDENEMPKIIEWNTMFPGMWENEALIGPLWSKEEVDEALVAREGVL